MSEVAYKELLRDGESVSMRPYAHGSQEWAYGCNFAPIDNNTHTQGNSVVIDIEPGGTTEPVLIEADIVLTVRVLQGLGQVVLWNAGASDKVLRRDLAEDGDSLVLIKGDAYYYVNGGPGNLILRDDSTPAFADGDEIMLTAAPGEGGEDGREIKLPVEFWLGFVRQE